MPGSSNPCSRILRWSVGLLRASGAAPDLPLKRDWGRLRGTAPWAYEVLRSVHGRGPTREEKASWFAAAGFRTPAEARP